MKKFIYLKYICFALFLFTLIGCGGEESTEVKRFNKEYILEEESEELAEEEVLEGSWGDEETEEVAFDDMVSGEENQGNEEATEEEAEYVFDLDFDYSSIEPAAGNPESEEPEIEPNDDKYRVILSVDSLINKNESGELHVWIGAPETEISFSAGTTQDETSIPQSIGKYAKITPIAPDFEIENPNTDKCYKLDPSGSEIIFIIRPKESGKYKVSAQIEIFETNDCSGASIPKAVKKLTVEVKVNTKKEIEKKVNSLWEILWDKFLSFWGALLALIFSALLFIIRRKIKKKGKIADDVELE